MQTGQDGVIMVTILNPGPDTETIPPAHGKPDWLKPYPGVCRRYHGESGTGRLRSIPEGDARSLARTWYGCRNSLLGESAEKGTCQILGIDPVRAIDLKGAKPRARLALSSQRPTERLVVSLVPGPG